MLRVKDIHRILQTENLLNSNNISGRLYPKKKNTDKSI